MNLTVEHLLSVVVLLIIDYLFYISLLRKLVNDYLDARRIIYNGHFVKGVIVGYQEKEDIDNYLQYSPIIEFIDNVGQKQVYTSSDMSFSKDKLNAHVDVYYDDNINNLIVDNGHLLTSRLCFVLLACIICLFVNFGMIYMVWI